VNPSPKTHPVWALCPYCQFAASYDPDRLILHTGYGTLYRPPDRNMTDTLALIAGFIASIRTAKMGPADILNGSGQVRTAVDSSVTLAKMVLSLISPE
jgi:hypothetical protein